MHMVSAVAPGRPAEHSWLVVGQLPAGNPLRAAFGAVPSQAFSYVLDPWSGIQCHSNEYPERFAQKMREWENQGKRLIQHSGPVLPFTSWAAAVLNSSLQSISAHQDFAPGFDKTRALNTAKTHLQNREAQLLSEQSHTQSEQALYQATRDSLQRDPQLYLQSRKAQYDMAIQQYQYYQQGHLPPDQQQRLSGMMAERARMDHPGYLEARLAELDKRASDLSIHTRETQLRLGALHKTDQKRQSVITSGHAGPTLTTVTAPQRGDAIRRRRS